MSQFTGHLRGNPEYVFRQSSMGGAAHIICNADDITEALIANDDREIRVDTFCRRNYKYGSMSAFERREGIVRNGCEICFTEWEPNERTAARRRETNRREEERLPF